MTVTAHTRRRRLLALVLTAVVGVGIVFAIILVGPGDDRTSANTSGPPTTRVADPAPQPPPREPSVVPVRDLGQPPGTVRLPDGGTAQLVHREIDASGTLPIPDGVDEATWWGAGIDADNGATVMAGHVNWNGEVGPFNQLWEAERGQHVTVTDKDRRLTRYEVSEVITLDKTELPSRAAELFGQGGPHRLVLVTCGGRFVGGDTGYDENRIVVAKPV